MRLVSMDFTHAFRQGGELNRKLSFIEKRRDDRVYGLFPEFKGFLEREQVRQFSAHLGQFSRAEADEIISLVPPAWEVDRDGRTSWATLITDRAHFVADNIESILWPQLELEGGIE